MNVHAEPTSYLVGGEEKLDAGKPCGHWLSKRAKFSRMGAKPSTVASRGIHVEVFKLNSSS